MKNKANVERRDGSARLVPAARGQAWPCEDKAGAGSAVAVAITGIRRKRRAPNKPNRQDRSVRKRGPMAPNKPNQQGRSGRAEDLRMSNKPNYRGSWAENEGQRERQGQLAATRLLRSGLSASGRSDSGAAQPAPWPGGRRAKQSQFAGTGVFARSLLGPVLAAVLCLWIAGSSATAGEVPKPKPVPRLQVIPMPYSQASFQRDGVEITRYHFGPGLRRPFLYPVVGPSGRSLTRMGHPHDPESHSHHNSVWISHHDVDGVDFWGDQRGGGTIRHRRIVEYEDHGNVSSIICENQWADGAGRPLLDETRTVSVMLLDDEEWLLIIDLTVKPTGRSATLGQTPFGMIGVRMAKTIGVDDGGGRIRNSEGGVNEKETFWKRARWVDYSGAIADGRLEGITLLDHPENPNHPSRFHVRDDGWMGASLTFDAPREIRSERPLHLRYGLYVHGDMKSKSAIETMWKKFVKTGRP